MLLIVLFVALATTFILINTWVTDMINSSLYRYTMAKDENNLEMQKAKFKTLLVIVMALFWALYIHYSA